MLLSSSRCICESSPGPNMRNRNARIIWKTAAPFCNASDGCPNPPLAPATMGCGAPIRLQIPQAARNGARS